MKQVLQFRWWGVREVDRARPQLGARHHGESRSYREVARQIMRWHDPLSVGGCRIGWISKVTLTAGLILLGHMSSFDLGRRAARLTGVALDFRRMPRPQRAAAHRLRREHHQQCRVRDESCGGKARHSRHHMCDIAGPSKVIAAECGDARTASHDSIARSLLKSKSPLSQPLR